MRECVEYLSAHLQGTPFEKLNNDLRRSWLRQEFKVDSNLSGGNRVQVALDVCESVVAGSPIRLRPRFGGNLHDVEIHKEASRLGISIPNPGEQLYRLVKEKVLNKMGRLEAICWWRNQLAHGHTTFSDCGANLTATDLQDFRDATVGYLRLVINSFHDYVANRRFERAT